MINRKYHETIGGYLLDIADLGSYFEVAVLDKDWNELHMKRGETLEELLPWYWGYRQSLLETERRRKKDELEEKTGKILKPLTGKYAELREAIKKALAYGEEASEGMEDGGASNFDSPTLHLPRWRKEKVMQAAIEAGTTASKDSMGWWEISPNTAAQGERRTIKARAIAEYLRYKGYDASVNYVMD